MKEAVILVHGVWSNGLDFWRLRLNLKRAGYACHVFNYHVWGKPPAETAAQLHTFTENIDAPVLHFIGHSLGGIILMHLFDQFPFNRQGRVVLMAAPVNGSTVGRRLASTPFTSWMLGKSSERGLDGDVPEWRGWQDIGVIAGTFPMGVGMVVGGLELPHDGTVSVAETQLKGATDYITLPVSHSGMLMSAEVSNQVITFLRSGKFDEETVTPILDSGVV